MPSVSPGWDVTTGPGLTALGLAASRLVESTRSDRLIDDPLAARFLAAIDSPVPFPTRWPEPEDAVPDRDRLHLHGSRYIGLRSRIYDDELLRAAEDGLRQVVLLAAGLDTRAVRLPWPPRVRIFELDQPQVLAFKDEVLAADTTVSGDRTSVGVDLRANWAEPLRSAGFRSDRPTAWLAEGLLAYLPPDAERALLERITALSAPGSRIAADRLLTTDAESVQRLTRRSGVAMDDLLDTSTRPTSTAVLVDLGWEVEEVDVQTLADRYERDLSDPFRAPTASAPPWLETAFVFGRLSGGPPG